MIPCDHHHSTTIETSIVTIYYTYKYFCCYHLVLGFEMMMEYMSYCYDNDTVVVAFVQVVPW